MHVLVRFAAALKSRFKKLSCPSTHAVTQLNVKSLHTEELKHNTANATSLLLCGERYVCRLSFLLALQSIYAFVVDCL